MEDSARARFGGALLVAATLAACGGGGGSSGSGDTAPKVAIGDANAPTVVAEGIDGGGAGVGGAAGGVLTGVSVSPTTGLHHGPFAALGPALRLLRSATLPALATGVAVDQTLPCTVSGNVRLTGDVSFGGPLAGDTLNLAFNACVEEGTAVVDGALALTVVSTNDSFTRLVADGTATQLAVTEAGIVERLDGPLHLVEDDTSGTTSVTTISSAAITLQRLRNGSVRATRQLTNYSYRLDLDLATLATTETFSYSASGTFARLGTVSFDAQTTQPLVTPANADFPSTGAGRVTGANGSSVLATVQDGGVQLQIDHDGDGAVDTTFNQTWAQIQAEL